MGTILMRQRQTPREHLCLRQHAGLRNRRATFSTTVSLMDTSDPEEFHVALNKVAARLARQRAQAAELSSSER